MIRNLLLPDYRIHEILSIIGALAFPLLILQLLTTEEKNVPSLIILTGAWGIFKMWESIIEHDEWKVITDEKIITKRLTLRNGIHCIS